MLFSIFIFLFQIIWYAVFIFIIVTVIKTVKNNNKNMKNNFNTYKPNYSNNNYNKDSKNSYYNKEKINAYQNQENMHNNHQLEEEKFDDVCTNIGYKKCPKCEANVSIKSEECFMCGHKFE